jgi:hypothetical protein
MHHFRGKLLQADVIRLDPANVYIQYHTNEGDRGQGWYGYVLTSTEGDLEPGGSYTLKLSDGRSGELRIDTVAPGESGKYRATFIGEGPLA